MLRRTNTAAGQQPQLQRKNKNQQDSQDKVGERASDDRRTHGKSIHQGIMLYSSYNTERKSDQDRNK